MNSSWFSRSLDGKTNKTNKKQNNVCKFQAINKHLCRKKKGWPTDLRHKNP